MEIQRSVLSNKEIGYLGEEATARYLMRGGYEIFGRNIRLSAGEIDIVALHKDTVCIVEVKAQVVVNRAGEVVHRVRGEYRPDIRVDYKKKRTLKALAAQLLDTNVNLRSFAIRFDIVAVYLDLLRNKAQIDHTVNIEL